MPNYNKIFLMGHLTRDPDLKFTSGGTAVAKFGLAVNRKYKMAGEWKTEVCFIDITAWGKLAEVCGEYLSKGRAAFVEGYLKLNQWETEDGQKRSKHEVVADSVQFLGGDSGNKGGSDNKDDIPF